MTKPKTTRRVLKLDSWYHFNGLTVSNPRNMQVLGHIKHCTSNHTCNQQVECKMFPQATQKSTQNS